MLILKIIGGEYYYGHFIDVEAGASSSMVEPSPSITGSCTLRVGGGKPYTTQMSQESETRQFSSPRESDLYNVLYANYHFIRHAQLKVKHETYSKPQTQ